MRHSAYIIVTIFISLLVSALTGCGGHNSEAWKRMDVAESIIEKRPDSSYQILQSIETSSLKGDEERARYALLMSMALDKNYIDTTNFNVLQPAIDYYLKKGTPDEKLRTYYYQGRIYQNQGDDDKAMNSFVNGCDLIQMSNDSLAVARILTAQGTLFYKQYKYTEYLANALKSMDLYDRLHKEAQLLRTYAKALNGAVLLNRKETADSLLKKLSIFENNNGYQEFIQPQLLTYTLTFGSVEEIRQKIEEYNGFDYPEEILLDLSYGYAICGDGNKATIYFNKIDSTSYIANTLKYLSIKSYVEEADNHYPEALRSSRIYNRQLEDFHRQLFSQDLLFAEKKHALETEKLEEAHNKDRAIWISIIVFVLSTIIIGWQNHRHQLLSVRARLSEQKRKLSEQEREKANQENENLHLRISQLETEREELKALPESNELPRPVTDAIKERIEMLNALLAEKITDNDSYTKQYYKWIDTITSDRDSFMNSTRLAFKASHPKFIEYLESHDLTEAEINYLCLYAIGLRGKEVGEYIQLKRHYHISSEIRRKLGIDEHETNISIYVRKLLRQL